MNRSSHPFSVWGRGRFVFSVWVGTGSIRFAGLGGDGVDPFRIAAGLFAQSSVRQGPGSQSGRPLSRWQFWQFGDGSLGTGSFRFASAVPFVSTPARPHALHRGWLPSRWHRSPFCPARRQINSLRNPMPRNTAATSRASCCEKCPQIPNHLAKGISCGPNQKAMLHSSGYY